MNKRERIDAIIEDLGENLYDSREFIMSLVRESLQRRSAKQLKELYEFPE